MLQFFFCFVCKICFQDTVACIYISFVFIVQLFVGGIKSHSY